MYENHRNDLSAKVRQDFDFVNIIDIDEADKA